MLKKLRHRFLRIAMFALCTIVSVQLFSVNTINILQRDTEVRKMLNMISDNGGIFPNNYNENQNYIDKLLNPFQDVHITIETPYSTRYFVVKLYGNQVTSVSTDNIASVTDRMALHYADTVYKNGEGYGFLEQFRYYYTTNHHTGESLMVFIDYQDELEATFRLFSLSLLVSVICILILIFPIWHLSKKAMRPVEKSIEKQRQFITDASHELKTPIAIISADADVLEMCSGENEWVTSIKNQTIRLDGLVKDLVTLSKLQEEPKAPEKTTFNLSKAVEETVSSFEILAKTNGITLTYDAGKNIMLTANENEIRQLISILSDNAVKYTTENGNINLTLTKNARSIILSMTNDCESISKEKLEKLFDRFYRADSSRSRETGGYGIGLSIAQVITERNGGKIEAISTKPDSVTFKITF